MEPLSHDLVEILNKFIIQKDDSSSNYMDRILLYNELEKLKIKSGEDKLDFSKSEHFLIIIRELLKRFKLYDDYRQICNKLIVKYFENHHFINMELDQFFKSFIYLDDNRQVKEIVDRLNQQQKYLYNTLTSLGLKLNLKDIFIDPNYTSDQLYEYIRNHFQKKRKHIVIVDDDDDDSNKKKKPKY